MRLLPDGRVAVRVRRPPDGRVVRMKYHIKDFPEYRGLADSKTYGMDLWRPFPDARMYYMEFREDGYVEVVWVSVGLLYPEGEGPNAERSTPPGD